MKHFIRTKAVWGLAIISLLGGGAKAFAADPISGKKAVAAVARKFGPEATAAIVELRGEFGQDQPKEWELISWDEKSRMNLHKYWIGEGTATDEDDAGDTLYPNNPPNGFVTLAKVRIDSTDAFTIAEGQARIAKMGFNSLNYKLAAMEYATEPVWTLDLIDADRLLVGKVYISAETGEVLRTLWIYREGRIPRIVDSAAPRKEELVPAPNSPLTEEETPALTPETGASTGVPPMPESLRIPASPAVPTEEGVTPPPTLPTTVPSPPSLGDQVIPPPPIPLEP